MTATTFSLRIHDHVLDRIEHNAQRQGVSRNAYILSWLPETQDPAPADNAQNAPEQGDNESRVGSRHD